jgi:transposase InsO family protein
MARTSTKRRLSKRSARRAREKAAGALPSDAKWIAGLPVARIQQLLDRVLGTCRRRKLLQLGSHAPTEADLLTQRIVEEYLVNYEKSRISTRQFIKEAGLEIHHTTLWKWVQRSKLHGSAAARKRLCGRRPCLSDARTLEVVCAWVHQPWKKSAEIAEDLRERWQRDGGQYVPCYRTFLKIIKSIRRDAAEILKGDLRAYHDKCRLVFRRFYPRPYHTWQLDEHFCDLFAYDPDTDETFRPWLIALIDCFTRAVPAADLVKNRPKAIDVLRIFHFAVTSKKEKDNPLVGAPENLQTDNAKIYECNGLKRSLEWVGVKHHFIDAHCPEQNGRIERFHKICETEFFSDFEAYVRRKCPRSKLVRDAVPLPLLRKLFQVWLRKYNFERQSRTHGKTPVRSFLDDRASIRARVVSDEELQKKLCLVEERIVQRVGIEMHRRLYTGACLVGWTSAKVIVAKPISGGDVWVKLPDGKEGSVALHEELSPRAKNKIKRCERARREELKALRRLVEKVPPEPGPHDEATPSDMAPFGPTTAPVLERKKRTTRSEKRMRDPATPIVVRVFARTPSVTKPPIIIGNAA